MRALRRLTSRSMTRARATTEQRISGQIGQPAACMIENKRVLSWRLDGARRCMARKAALQLYRRELWSRRATRVRQSSTAAVDNIVRNRARPRKAAQCCGAIALLAVNKFEQENSLQINALSTM